MNTNEEARAVAVRYAVDDLGWDPNTKAIGCLPDPKVEGTFLVAIQGDVEGTKGVRIALLVCNGRVTNETEMPDFFANGGKLDETEKVKPVKAVQFDLGPIVSTPGALEALQRNGSTGIEYLQRHARGDWGNLDDEDKAANDAAVVSGARLLSAYRLPDGTKLWIITDAEIDDQHHRAASTFLLPDEY